MKKNKKKFLFILMSIIFLKLISFTCLQIGFEIASVTHGDVSLMVKFARLLRVDLNKPYVTKDVSIEETTYFIIEASEKLSINTVRTLLENQANPNVESKVSGETPLINAVDKSDSEMCELLLSYNADPNYKNRKGKSAKMLAVEIKNDRIVKLLSY